MKNRIVKEQTWVREVLKEYGDIEAQPKSVDSIVEAWPDWVTNLWLSQFAIRRLPAISLNFKHIKKWTARDLGQFLGRQNALERLVWDEIPLSPRVRDEKERWMVDAGKLSHQLGAHPEFAVILKEGSK